MGSAPFTLSSLVTRHSSLVTRYSALCVYFGGPSPDAPLTSSSPDSCHEGYVTVS
jgi:hypothetical protein